MDTPTLCKQGARIGAPLVMRAAVWACLVANLARSVERPPPPASGVRFSGVFSDKMVLQRDTQAAVFGWCGTTGHGAEVFSRCTFTAGATVEVTMTSAADRALTRVFTTHATIAGDGTWKALLPATGAGGAHSVSAACTHGCGNASAAVLDDVTFGVRPADVLRAWVARARLRRGVT